MAYEGIIYQKKEGIATITLNRPRTLNALNAPMIRSLMNALADIDQDDRVKVAVLTGAGRGFCSGGDIKDMRPRGHESLAQTRERYRRGIHQIPLAVHRLQKPVIASVNGPAVGPGCDLALMCDIRIASESASFGEVYVQVGLVPSEGGTYFLPRTVGLSRACEMIFTGELIGAWEAKEIGLVSRVVPPDKLKEETHALARKIADGPPLAIRFAKAAIYHGLSYDLPTHLELLAFMQSVLYQTEDHHEGVRAFVEKRKPIFQGW